MASIIFIGAGNLATHLAQALQRAGHSILQVYSRTEDSARLLVERLGLAESAAITQLEKVIPDADVYIYALRDEVLASIINQVSVSPSALHLHTAGSIGLDVFGADKPNAGVLYPFQTFSKDKEVEFSKIPILVEAPLLSPPQGGRCPADEILQLAQSISPLVYQADGQARAQLHLAGVFACNFTNCMYRLAEEQLQGSGLPFEVLLPLIDETAAKVHTLSPQQAQTGPAIRHDEKVMQAHINRLKSPEEQAIYRMLSQNIQQHEK